ncbi:pilus assembly FimT family protein [Desulfitobacterium metallireducens]|uniref:Prepilin-type N-terminal cleavage/methylation domain-containing protein n=1 Tax=Desulfitobacterium metallireducens DSM 15288 TaxID=871968 RepID=W0ECZ8_9FIRM|nr:prepilin-type N-terminal cleavage/methylation domain-containing protein [Desulfitobacterium metallireducens]AHF08637.1 hypothetical protein DESME_10645 [Desulfitobacterium metallireducens DSM 15288]
MSLRQRDKGFTLIELMIVIALVGILALVTAPKYGAVKDQYRLQSSAEAVTERLGHAQQLAMDRREDVYVKLTANSVEVIDKNGNSLGEAAQFDTGVRFVSVNTTDPDLLPYKSVGLVTTIPIPDSTDTDEGIKYDLRGFVRSGEAKVVLTNASRAKIEILVESVTGKVTISG